MSAVKVLEQLERYPELARALACLFLDGLGSDDWQRLNKTDKHELLGNNNDTAERAKFIAAIDGIVRLHDAPLFTVKMPKSEAFRSFMDQSPRLTPRDGSYAGSKAPILAAPIQNTFQRFVR